MGFRLTQVVLGVCAAAWLAGATSAHAFTFQNAPQGGDYSVPKFDLEEQAKQFRKDGSGSGNSSKFSTPFGEGKLQFGVQQNGQSSPFAPGFSPTPGYRYNNGSHFERMLTPENFR
jgi:hypothetical protein